MNYSHYPGIITKRKAAVYIHTIRAAEEGASMKFRNWLTGVMAGRNGADQLCRFLSILAVVLLLLSLLTGGTALGSILWILGLASLVWGSFRSFSRNLERRRAENAAYLRRAGRIREIFSGALSRARQRKDYRFFRCPSCRIWLRVPRNKGRVQSTCRQCGERFTRKT